MIYTRKRPSVGEYRTSSTISRMFSTPLLLAASISTTFIEAPAAIALQVAHSLQGLPFCGFSQLIARARILATEVFPVPRVPQNRYAWPIRSDRIWFLSVRTISSCPFTSSNVSGRNFRYNAVYAISFFLSAAGSSRTAFPPCPGIPSNLPFYLEAYIFS